GNLEATDYLADRHISLFSTAPHDAIGEAADTAALVLRRTHHDRDMGVALTIAAGLNAGGGKQRRRFHIGTTNTGDARAFLVVMWHHDNFLGPPVDADILHHAAFLEQQSCLFTEMTQHRRVAALEAGLDLGAATGAK